MPCIQRLAWPEPPTSYSAVTDTSPLAITLAFAVVPPMSNEIRLGRANCLPASDAAITPAAGPDSTAIAGMRSPSAMSNTPPDEPITCSLRQPKPRNRALQPVEIGRQHRPHHGAHRRRAGALELADLGQHLR